MMRNSSFALLSMLFLFCSAGCTVLKPWERGSLVDPAMTSHTSPLEAGHDEHVMRTREGMAGASGTGGVSCGCN
ncbi:MAG: DUF4266 domain-containing protein [Deltaproteobacteria bacterium]|nr:DUF4266 domain-containing protein [Deltaproteobacteria bacterium]